MKACTTALFDLSFNLSRPNAAFSRRNCSRQCAKYSRELINRRAQQRVYISSGSFHGNDPSLPRWPFHFVFHFAKSDVHYAHNVGTTMAERFGKPRGSIGRKEEREEIIENRGADRVPRTMRRRIERRRRRRRDLARCVTRGGAKRRGEHDGGKLQSAVDVKRINFCVYS